MENYIALQQLLESLGFEVVYECCGASSSDNIYSNVKARNQNPKINSKIEKKEKIVSYEIESNKNKKQFSPHNDKINPDNDHSEKRGKRLWQEWCISADRELKSLVKGFGQDWIRIGLIMERNPNSVQKRYEAIYGDEEDEEELVLNQTMKKYPQKKKRRRKDSYLSQTRDTQNLSQMSTYFKSQPDNSSKYEFKQEQNSSYNFRQESSAMNNQTKRGENKLGKRTSFEKIFDLSLPSQVPFGQKGQRKKLKTSLKSNKNLLPDMSREVIEEEQNIPVEVDKPQEGYNSNQIQILEDITTPVLKGSEIKMESCHRDPQDQIFWPGKTGIKEEETLEDILFGKSNTQKTEDFEELDDIFGDTLSLEHQESNKENNSNLIDELGEFFFDDGTKFE